MANPSIPGEIAGRFGGGSEINRQESQFARIPLPGYRLKDIYQFTNLLGTYYPPKSVKALWIRAWGGGGGGGGAAAAAGQFSSGGGGASGGYAELFTTRVLTSYVYVCGAGGAGGIAGPPGAGATGGNTSFGNIVLAMGGTGGSPGISSATFIITSGGSPQIGWIGDFGGAGEHGAHGFGAFGLAGRSGFGGNSLVGIGGAFRNGDGAGVAATGYGAGGGGAWNNNAGGAGAYAGGAGSQGIIIVAEYF